MTLPHLYATNSVFHWENWCALSAHSPRATCFTERFGAHETGARCFTGKPSAEFSPFRARIRHELPETVPVQCNMAARDVRLAIALLDLLSSSSSSSDEEELLEYPRKIPKIENFV